MRAWLLTISETFPQHWAYAKDVGFWDMVTPRSIHAGDVVYFWQSGPKGSLLGKVQATEDAWPIEDPDAVPAGPWDDWPGQPEKPYKSRFSMGVLAADSVESPSWTAVKQATGLRQTPSWVRTLTRVQAEVLDDYIGGEPGPRLAEHDASAFGDALELDFNSTLTQRRPPRGPLTGRDLEAGLRNLLRDYGADLTELDIAAMDQDTRTFAMKLVVIREGQEAFRDVLMRAYRACAITGFAVEQALDAAHIKEYGGRQSHDVRNGMLLRSDLHKLFDKHLLTVTTDYEVRVSPKLRRSPYFELNGQPLVTLPADSRMHPSQVLLQGHNHNCDWLAA